MADKISLGDLVTATIKVSNDADTKRKYNISADVTIKGKSVTDIRLGQVLAKTTETQLAYFNANTKGYLDIGFNDTQALGVEEQGAILVAVNAFIADVVASVENVTTGTIL